MYFSRARGLAVVAALAFAFAVAPTSAEAKQLDDVRLGSSLALPTVSAPQVRFTGPAALAPPAGVHPYIPPAGPVTRAPRHDLSANTNPSPLNTVATEVAEADKAQAAENLASSATGDLQTQSLVRRIINAGTAGWATARGEPGRFMVAEGKNGWGFDVVTERDTSSWRFGWLSGGTYSNGAPRVAGCLWLLSSLITTPGGTPTADCSPYGNLTVDKYMAIWNGNRPGINCFPDSTGHIQCDGSPAVLDNSTLCPNGTWFLQNVRPWDPTAPYPLEADAWIPFGTTLLWRYVTKDNRYVTVRWPNRPGGGQDWGFMTGACFTNLGYSESWVSAQ